MATSVIASSGGDYTSLQAWENAIVASPGAGQLDETESQTASIEEKFDVGAMTWNNGSTAENYVTVASGYRANEESAWATDQPSAVSTAARSSLIHSYSAGLTIEYLGVEAGTSAGLITNDAAAELTVRYCFVATARAGAVRCISGTLNAYGTVATNADHGSLGSGFLCQGGTMNVDYCDAVNNLVAGFHRTGGTMTVNASRGLANTTDFSGIIGGNYNLSSDATAPGATNYRNLTTTNIIVSATSGSEDCHWASGNDGTYDSAPAGTGSVDIEGNTRVDWDAGPFEIVAAGGGATPKGVFGLPIYGPLQRGVF